MGCTLGIAAARSTMPEEWFDEGASPRLQLSGPQPVRSEQYTTVAPQPEPNSAQSTLEARPNGLDLILALCITGVSSCIALWLWRSQRRMRQGLSTQTAEIAHLRAEAEMAALERERMQALLAKEDERRVRAEAMARLASLSEQSVQRSYEEVLDTLDRELSGTLEHVLDDAQAAKRRDLPSSERRRLLERIAREGEAVNDSLGELVDLRRLHRGDLRMEWSSIPFVDICERLSAWAEPQAEARRQRFDLVAEGSLPGRIRTDARRLLRLLRMLVQRALAPAGGGRVLLLIDTEPGATACLRFIVRRQGAAQAQRRHPQGAEAQAPLACDLDLSLSVAMSIAEELGGELVQETGDAPSYSLRIHCQGSTHAPLAGPREEVESQDLLSQTNQRLATALLAGKRILVADDAEENLRIIEWVLGRAGADCTLVENGREALERVVFAEKHGTPYDLILLDLEMPLMDGYEAVQNMRSKGSTTPIFALTAHTSEEERQRCMVLGFNDFLCKPVDRSVLLRQIAARFYPTREESDVLVKAALPAPSQPSEGALRGAESAATRPALRSLFSADEGMTELIDWFAEEMEKDIERIERAMESGDRAALSSVVHQLKGSAGSYGFPSLSEQAERVEALLARSEDTAHVYQEVRVLIDLCQRVQGA